MNTVLKVGDLADAVLHEFTDSTMTKELPPVGPVTYVSDDPSVATVDASTGMITAVAPSKLDANNQPIPVKITGTDAGNGLSASDTVTDSPLAPPVATFATLVITPRTAPTPAPAPVPTASKPSGSGVSFP